MRWLQHLELWSRTVRVARTRSTAAPPSKRRLPGAYPAHTRVRRAAIRYRTTLGTTEIALIEWKYTEQYSGHELKGELASMQVRHERYRDLFYDPNGPVRSNLLPYEDLFVEPFYQLLRLQILADQMERVREGRADRVRVLYVAPSRNEELWQSLNRTSQIELASLLVSSSDPLPVLAVWEAHLRRPNRFVYLDSAALLSDESPTGSEFRARYGHMRGDGEQGSTSAGARIYADVQLSGWGELSLDGPWASWLPSAWLAASTPAATAVVPTAPSTADCPMADAIAWWTPLPHLLGYAFGWDDYALGLRAWQELGRPTQDPRLALIERWWGPSVEAFAFWISSLRDQDSDTADPYPRYASVHWEQQGRLPIVQSLLTGGWDPLHLHAHAPIPERPRVINSARAAALAEVAGPDSDGHTFITFPRYEGWYEALDEIGESLGNPRTCIISAFCREVGHLGDYHKSPVTGRWFSGSHHVHLLGMPDDVIEP